MELIIFLALVGLGAIILLIWALMSNDENNDVISKFSCNIFKKNNI